MDATKAAERAVAFLDARIALDTLWLYGSEARGTAGATSDLDLGALFQGRPSPLAVLELRGALEAELGREVDLVDLDAASPFLAMQVLRHGRLVVDRNPRRRHAFFARTVSMYEDLKILRREAERALLQRVAHGGP